MTLSIREQFRRNHRGYAVTSPSKSISMVYRWCLLWGAFDTPPTRKDIEGWTTEQRADAEYFLRWSHYKASDNVVRVPPMPDFFKPFTSGRVKY